MSYLITRFLSSFLVGMILSQTGTLIQLGTKNILASPSTLGFDGLSVLWLLIVHSVLVFFELNYSFEWGMALGLPVFFFLGLLYAKSLGAKVEFERTILLGLTFNLLVGAVFSLWQFFFLAFNLPFPSELWFGHFRYASSTSLICLLIAAGVLNFWIQWNLSKFKLFSFGKSLYKNWGLDTGSLFKGIFVVVSLGTFIVVNLFGAFSFLGLVFPIIARKLWFKNRDLQGEFLWGGILNGSILMLLDACCYYFPIYGAEVPAGLIVSGVGAVSLILLLWLSFKDSETLAKTQK